MEFQAKYLPSAIQHIFRDVDRLKNKTQIPLSRHE